MTEVAIPVASVARPLLNGSEGIAPKCLTESFETAVDPYGDASQPVDFCPSLEIEPAGQASGLEEKAPQLHRDVSAETLVMGAESQEPTEDPRI